VLSGSSKDVWRNDAICARVEALAIPRERRLVMSEEVAEKPGGFVKRWMERVQSWIDEVGVFIEGTVFWRIWERMLENEFIDRSVALAGKAFVSFFPAIIVVAAFAPPSLRASILTTVTHRLGLSGPGLATVRSAFADANSTRRATGIAGLIFTFFYINSFTTALGRVYLRAWPTAEDRDRRGLRAWRVVARRHPRLLRVGRRSATFPVERRRHTFVRDRGLSGEHCALVGDRVDHALSDACAGARYRRVRSSPGS
jgi:hypothetical protein